MRLNVLKRALVEVSKICREHQSCRNCDFGYCVDSKLGYYNCRLAPFLDNAAVPDEWEIADWKEDSNGKNT